MSKIKTPAEKKEHSLERDRRNVYGENQKSSRKNIPRSKQLKHMAERRSTFQTLQHLKGAFDEPNAEEIESTAKVKTIVRRRKGFRKMPDKPLKDVLAMKSARRRP